VEALGVLGRAWALDSERGGSRDHSHLEPLVKACRPHSRPGAWWKRPSRPSSFPCARTEACSARSPSCRGWPLRS